ncbi:MAG: hypothetical protein ACYCW6_04220 [Candidatus Xenobia bacterium]
MHSIPMSVCLNHTDRPAPNRCSSCLKPICNECVVRADAAIFCSADCRDKAAAHAARVGSLDSGPRKSPLGGLVSLLGTVIVVGALAWLSWPYLPHSFKAMIQHLLAHP